MAHPELKTSISKFENLLKRIEIALEQEKMSKHVKPCHTEQIINLEEETKALEDEAQRLLKKLSIETNKAPHCFQCTHVTSSGTKAGQSLCYCCGDNRKK